ncbi:hypothetical protein ACET3X_006396 [Alternaria dauci]|uniref:F-box domain-containing protein n=1 Tax=Alternaria dauci TaxID=48095 RepID=A0ABR3UDK5_9PLEO
MAGRKRAASPSTGGASAVEKSKKKGNKNKLSKPPAVQRLRFFPFLRLPAEIRNIIYHYVFYGTRISLRPALRKIQPTGRPNLSLLYVCRQLHDETALLPYMLTSFDVNYSMTTWNKYRDMKLFLEKRSRAQIEALADVRLRYNQGSVRRMEQSGDGAYWMAQFGLLEPAF